MRKNAFTLIGHICFLCSTRLWKCTYLFNVIRAVWTYNNLSVNHSKATSFSAGVSSGCAIYWEQRTWSVVVCFSFSGWDFEHTVVVWRWLICAIIRLFSPTWTSLWNSPQLWLSATDFWAVLLDVLDQWHFFEL